MSDPDSFNQRRHADDLAFPRQQARTRGFTSGQPRTITVSPDGERVVFLRSRAGDDSANSLWVLGVGSGEERVVHDPRASGSEAGEATLTPAERARRERARERATGVVAYATDRDVTKAVFVEGGRLMLADLVGGDVEALPTPGTPDDPRLDPTGTRIAYVVDGALHVHEIGGLGRVLASDDEPDVTWGLAEFVAAEEMDRTRGYWFSPDGALIAACRVDERRVRVWWIADPTVPDAEPRPMRYPQAGTANAIVTLHVFDVATGERVDVVWDQPERFEYLARVDWPEGAPLTLLIETRDQRTTRVVEVDTSTGTTSVAREDFDPKWIDLVVGAPARLRDGTLVATIGADDARRLTIGGEPVTPAGVDVAHVLNCAEDVVFAGSEHVDPTQTHVWRAAPGSALVRLSAEPGLHTAAVGGDVVALKSWGADDQHPRVAIVRKGEVVGSIGSLAEEPLVDPRPVYANVGERQLRAALIVPGGRQPQDRVPVLLAPYGGPHFLAVQRWRGNYREAQFYADRLGVAVLVIDGRGTPGRGATWERQVYRDFTITLQDQVDGLRAAAKRWSFLDLGRVAIIGWSFGGLLAAMAVIDRPDVFHAAVSGAPVTDQHLYDTHYTERYLGHPDLEPEAYRRSSPITRADRLRRPLLLIHGLADDNVVAANTLQLSAKLFSAGIPHELALLPNASHMGGFDELVVGRHLTVLDFLRRSLDLPTADASP